MLSLTLYSLSSITASVLVVLYAYATRIRFYPTVVFLFTSKIASVSMINLAVVFTVLFGLGCTRLFLGRLRDAETDAVWESMRFSVTETAFALTTFRDELNAKVGVLFGIMLFAKVFHLLHEARVEHVEQAHQTTILVHIRMIALSITLLLLNSCILFGCTMHLSAYGPSVFLLFAFEHAVLLVSLVATICRYGIAVYDVNFVQGRWQNKSQYEMYIALISDALQFVAYMVFAGVVFTYYGVPIHLMRSLYMTFRNLTERATHFIRYKRIMHSLNERFPDATEEELAATDRVCIICREDMDLRGGAAGTPKKLSCGHLFHSICLQNWLERQFSCPTCRRAIPIGLPQPGAAAPAAGGPNAAPVEAAAPAGAAAQEPQPQQAAVQARRHEPVETPPTNQTEQGPPQVQGAGATQAPRTESNQERIRRAVEQRLSRASQVDNDSPTPTSIPAASSGTLANVRKQAEATKPNIFVGEEEKVADHPSSPLPIRKDTRKDLLSEDERTAVLFQDFASSVQSLTAAPLSLSMESRAELLRLEMKVCEIQLQVAKEAHEFAFNVIQLQQEQQQRMNEK